MLYQKNIKYSSPNEKRLQLFLTEVCNLSCKHCYLGSREKRHFTFSSEEINKALKLFSKLGVKNLDFTGGEPTYHPLLPSLIEEAKKQNYKKISIVTNGTNPDLFKKINPKKVLIRFSLDGITPQTHDYLRGQGVFKKCISSLKLALRKGFSVEIIFTVHSRNIQEVEKAIKFLDKMKVSRISFNVVSIMGNAEKNKNLAISPYVWLKLRKKIKQIKVKNTTLRFPLLFATKKEYKQLIKNGYKCGLAEPKEYILLANKKIFHCCLLVDTSLNTYYLGKQLEKNPEQSEMDLYHKFSCLNCMVLDRIPEKIGFPKINHDLIPVCVYWKEFVTPESKG